MNPISETKFKERVQKDLKQFGDEIDVLKTQEKGRKGVPDLIICLKGNYVAIELKKLGEKATPLQEHKLAKIRKAGGYAFSADESTWPAQFKILQRISGQ